MFRQKIDMKKCITFFTILVHITDSFAPRTRCSSSLVSRCQQQNARPPISSSVQKPISRLYTQQPVESSPPPESVWEKMASIFIDIQKEPNKMSVYVQLISAFRILVPASGYATVAFWTYPTISLGLAHLINDSGVFAVVSQDSSQFIQNILTTSGLVFSLLTGQTWFFMYQQQEAIYLALFEEVTMAKSLLEQVALVSQGRPSLYEKILQAIDRYVREDLTRFNDVEPAELISARPVDDPLEDILYLTSVGEPSIVYQTIRSLRQARAYRLGALQRKLPMLHSVVLYLLAAIVLFTFPLLGAGSQTIGGEGILHVQAWYLGFIVFGITMILGVVDELQRPGEQGAYNARSVLLIMIGGLEEELQLRMQGKMGPSYGPTVDSDGAFDEEMIWNRE